MKWLHWRLGAATGRVVDVTDLLRDEELLHGHLVHGGEVSLNHVNAVMIIVADTEVLLEVDNILCDPERVIHVCAHPLHAFHTLRAGERPGLLVIHESGHILGLADAPGHADVDGPVHEVVVDDHLEHRDVVVGQVLDAHVHGATPALGSSWPSGTPPFP